MGTTLVRPRYRTRTRIRGYLPFGLLWLAPKGRRDCGEHEWYLESKEGVLMPSGYAVELRHYRCYHCKTGRWTDSVR